MDRRDFLLSCVGTCLVASGAASCKKEVQTPNPGEIVEVDLNTNILTVGSFIKTKGILVIRLLAGNAPANFASMEGICPHAGGELEWSTSENLVVCPVHGSRFQPAGTLVNGPAARNLKTFTLSVTGNILQVKVN